MNKSSIREDDLSVQNPIQNNQSNKRDTKIKFSKFINRSIDILFSSIGLLIMLPLFISISICYSFGGDSRGPVLFKQIRMGQGGKKFYIYKFRSMIVNAEARLKQDQSLYEKYIKNNYKLEPEEDPRITNLGRFLRSTSLDEIPQLINVLKGEMSLVGPRPVVEEELKEYGIHSEKLLTVKPGVTGYWAINGRSNVNYPERANLEIYYVNNKSLKLDFKILVKTVSSVLLRRGAY